jgi:prolyl-tRNA synthetase
MTLLVLVSLRGDQDVNEVKLQNELVKLASQYSASTVIGLTVPDAAAQAQWAAKPLPLGYMAPDLADSYIKPPKPAPVEAKAIGSVVPKFLRMVDRTAVDLKNFATGSDEAGFHVVGANWGTEFKLPELVVDVRKAAQGDRATHDPSQILQTARGIEIGHIFQLGTQYSKALGATYTNEQGEEIPLVMGCYGVGVSRLAQSAVEQSHDKDGIVWSPAIAPYHAIVVVPNVSDAAQMEAAESLYASLNQAGIETLLDDRNERAGVKFKDADLIGIPYRIVTGKSLKDGKVEVVQRATRAVQEIAIADVLPTLQQWLAES